MLLTLGVEDVQGAGLERFELLYRAIARLVGARAVGNGRPVPAVLLQGATPTLDLIAIVLEFGRVVLRHKEVLRKLLVFGVAGLPVHHRQRPIVASFDDLLQVRVPTASLICFCDR
jgi:hypothetical protein